MQTVGAFLVVAMVATPGATACLLRPGPDRHPDPDRPVPLAFLRRMLLAHQA